MLDAQINTDSTKSQIGLEAGFISYGDPESAIGCSVRVRLAPASGLIVASSAKVAAELADPDLAGS